MMLQRIVLTLVMALAAPGVAAAENLDAEDISDLERVSSYLNEVDSLQGRFIQVASNGVQDSGDFYLRRPGGLRFEYDEPNPILIVADGTWVVLSDRKLKTVDRYPLSATPLKYLLKKEVDLASESNVVAVEREPGVLIVVAREDDGPAQGELTLIFSDPALELLQWIKDAQVFTTTVALQDVKRGVDLSPRLFRVEEAQPFRRR